MPTQAAIEITSPTTKKKLNGKRLVKKKFCFDLGKFRAERNQHEFGNLKRQKAL